MDVNDTLRIKSLREKLVTLLLSNPNHIPSRQNIKSENLMFARPLDNTTTGLSDNLIRYIETGISDANDLEAYIPTNQPKRGLESV